LYIGDVWLRWRVIFTISETEQCFVSSKKQSKQPISAKTTLANAKAAFTWKMPSFVPVVA